MFSKKILVTSSIATVAAIALFLAQHQLNGLAPKTQDSVEERINNDRVLLSTYEVDKDTPGNEAHFLEIIAHELKAYSDKEYKFPETKIDKETERHQWEVWDPSKEPTPPKWINKLGIPTDDLKKHSSLIDNPIKYKSNGYDYKVLASDEAKCSEVRSKNYSLVDRNNRENCNAYGFWTWGARNW